jgi:hypothetical protein
MIWRSQYLLQFKIKLDVPTLHDTIEIALVVGFGSETRGFMYLGDVLIGRSERCHWLPSDLVAFLYLVAGFIDFAEDRHLWITGGSEGDKPKVDVQGSEGDQGANLVLAVLLNDFLDIHLVFFGYFLGLAAMQPMIRKLMKITN